MTVAEQGALLTANRDLSSPAIGGLQEFWQKAIDATAGWSVYLVDDKGQPTDELASTPPGDTQADPHHPRHPVADARPAGRRRRTPARGPRGHLTLDRRHLAAAQNPAANAQGPIAFSGSYPPGSTFKTITTAAALQAGLGATGHPRDLPRHASPSRTAPSPTTTNSTWAPCR